MKIAIAKTPIEHKLFALQAEWDRAGPLAREAIAQQIRDNPTWNITIGPDGPLQLIDPEQRQKLPVTPSNRGIESNDT
jgi:hypothetical protein